LRDAKPLSLWAEGPFAEPLLRWLPNAPPKKIKTPNACFRRLRLKAVYPPQPQPRSIEIADEIEFSAGICNTRRVNQEK
jgi:hypothetical protein